MKRVLALSLIVTMALLFTGCKNGNKTPEKDINADQPSFSQGEVQEPEAVVEEPVFKISTSKGDIVVKLYKETPLHRDNFVKLARSGYFDGMLFHRVIKNFMIQGGDPFTKQEGKEAQYGTGGPNYTIPAEIVPGKTHKKGALAAARRGDNVNPEKASSGSQFYLVQSEDGCKHLDGEYTIFGETISGLDVIDKIASVATNNRNLPLEPVKIISVKEVKE
ncbi:MAG: peptidylprolyl isomerase [Bacteroidales bacterium]|nr:peptidylprolyl isomerase [Bacteroidales bacterium]